MSSETPALLTHFVLISIFSVFTWQHNSQFHKSNKR